MEENEKKSESFELFKKMLEQSKYQNQLLGSMINYFETITCQLEKISKQTCQSVNELHWQTTIQKKLLKEISTLLEIYKYQKPDAVARIGELEDIKKQLEKCCPSEKDKDRIICKYKPCIKSTKDDSGSHEGFEGKAIPKKVKDAPYGPIVKVDNPSRPPNNRPGLEVPRGPFKGLISESLGSKPQVMGAADGAPDPVIFGTYTFNNTVSPASANAADISGAQSGRNNNGEMPVIMLSGNWYVQYSTDGGQTFTTLNPTTIFPNTLAGGFCCDQVIQYVPSIDRFIWLLQYSSTTSGNNAYRLASASPQDIIDSNCTAWTYWDLTSASFNLGTDWMDYPSLSVGNNSLYLSFDVLDSVPDSTADNGLVVVRIPLDEIRDSATINFWYTNPGDSALAWGSNVSQNTGDEVFWGGHIDNSTIRVFSWKENSNTYFWRSVDVNNWPNQTRVSNGPNGNNWFAKVFPNNAIIGITRKQNEIWMSWMASSGDGGFGGFSFPHPHVQLVKIEIGSYNMVEQMQIWNPDFAFGYPCLATNTNNEVGIALGWGGGGSLNANSAVGIIGDYVVWYRDGSTWTHTRWGDYVSARQAGSDPRLFAGFGYVILQDATTTAGHRFDPYYVLFGRESIINPPIG
ncbi:hypothetical protein [Aequorivita capsosiphonis]|uniref:hypothetical protein n=1 Tax=Aequorivita capsosiphonis TaxID=487317 RepID=UPI00047BEBDE|nr:hypothetical protein [Aequorivita capsosiphonis]